MLVDNTSVTRALPSTLDECGEVFTSIPKHEMPGINYPFYIDKAMPLGIDVHLSKEEVITLYKLNKTLIHKKLDPESDDYDEDFPAPLYISPRKPVWILSELIAWQESLKAKRNAGGGK